MTSLGCSQQREALAFSLTLFASLSMPLSCNTSPRCPPHDLRRFYLGAGWVTGTLVVPLLRRAHGPRATPLHLACSLCTTTSGSGPSRPAPLPRTGPGATTGTPTGGTPTGRARSGLARAPATRGLTLRPSLVLRPAPLPRTGPGATTGTPTGRARSGLARASLPAAAPRGPRATS